MEHRVAGWIFACRKDNPLKCFGVDWYNDEEIEESRGSWILASSGLAVDAPTAGLNREFRAEARVRKDVEGRRDGEDGGQCD